MQRRSHKILEYICRKAKENNRENHEKEKKEKKLKKKIQARHGGGCLNPGHLAVQNHSEQIG